MTRKQKKAWRLFMRVLRKYKDTYVDKDKAFYKELKGERASNNWRRLHGMKPLRRVTE